MIQVTYLQASFPTLQTFKDVFRH